MIKNIRSSLLLILLVGFLNLKSTEIDEPVSKVEKTAKNVVIVTTLAAGSAFLIGTHLYDCSRTPSAKLLWSYCIDPTNKHFNYLPSLGKLFTGALYAGAAGVIAKFTMCTKRRKRDRSPVLPHIYCKKDN